LLKDLEHACRVISGDDQAGQAWSAEHNYSEYTSYASLNDLIDRDPAFADLARVLESHAAQFAKVLEFDLGGRKLGLNRIWINILAPGGCHTAHIHTHSALSDTPYVVVPKGASVIKFEDPRLPLMMAAPPKRAKARAENLTFVSAVPKAGTLLLWERWLRREVPVNAATSDRISIAFNFGW
jgi:uncharacterized protein (TIGR02466 family)